MWNYLNNIVIVDHFLKGEIIEKSKLDGIVFL